MSPGKRHLINVAFIIFVIASVEGIARVAARLDHPFGRMNAAVMADPILHHTYVPSSTPSGLPYTLHINSQSWPEDHEIEKDKRPGVFRIFMVGDSTTQGYVNPNARWATLVGLGLNRRTNHTGTGRATFEVINAGRVSYSPVLYYLHIKHQILPFSPDLVVINVDMTDCRDDAIYRRSMRTNSVGEVLDVPPYQSTLAAQGLITTPTGIRKLTVAEKLTMWLVHRSAFVAYLQLGIAKIVGPLAARHRTANVARVPDVSGLQVDWLEKTWTAQIESNAAFSMSMLGKSIELLRENHVQCIVVGVPHFPQFAGASSIRPFEVLADTARQHDVLFLNLYAALAPRIMNTVQTDFYQPEDPVHFNAAGNQLWADAFLEFWEKNETRLAPH